MIQAGLVLEGGGMRGIYTAGVLDFFMDKGMQFENGYGVSAGACHLCSYLSNQRGRAYRVGVNYLKDKRYCSVYSLLTTGDLFGADFCYNRLPNELDRYDYAQMERYPGKAYVVVTNVQTGEAEYILLKDMHKDIQAVRASSSLPLVSRMVEYEGKRYLDGGIADSIPIRRSVADGNTKHVVILTRDQSYRKKPNEAMPLIRARYRKYPELVKQLEQRHLHYNETLRYIEEQEKTGGLFVIRPKQPVKLGRVEKDEKKLRALYEQGYEDALNQYARLKKYLEKEN